MSYAWYRSPITAITVCAAIFTGSIGPTAEVSVESGTPSQREMVEWATGRFSAAGLRLPAITIEFPGRDLSGCDGAPARSYLDRRPQLIKVCWNDRFILLHELAHVWESVNVPLERHQPFIEMRSGAWSWAGLDAPWGSRGREHAANVIAWGLLEKAMFVSDTYPNDPTSMIVAFRFLTGRTPLHDGGADVVVPDRSLFSDRPIAPVESGR